MADRCSSNPTCQKVSTIPTDHFHGSNFYIDATDPNVISNGQLSYKSTLKQLCAGIATTEQNTKASDPTTINPIIGGKIMPPSYVHRDVARSTQPSVFHPAEFSTETIVGPSNSAPGKAPE